MRDAPAAYRPLTPDITTTTPQHDPLGRILAPVQPGRRPSECTLRSRRVAEGRRPHGCPPLGSAALAARDREPRSMIDPVARWPWPVPRGCRPTTAADDEQPTLNRHRYQHQHPTPRPLQGTPPPYSNTFARIFRVFRGWVWVVGGVWERLVVGVPLGRLELLAADGAGGFRAWFLPPRRKLLVGLPPSLRSVAL